MQAVDVVLLACLILLAVLPVLALVTGQMVQVWRLSPGREGADPSLWFTVRQSAALGWMQKERLERHRAGGGDRSGDESLLLKQAGLERLDDVFTDGLRFDQMGVAEWTSRFFLASIAAWAAICMLVIGGALGPLWLGVPALAALPLWALGHQLSFHPARSRSS